MALRGFRRIGVGRLVEGKLEQEGNGRDDERCNRRHISDRSADLDQHQQKYKEEQHVGEGGDGARRKELPHLLEFLQVAGKAPRGCRPCRELDRHHMGIDAACQQHIGAPSGRVDQPASERADGQIENQRRCHADGKNPKGGDRLVRQHPVIDIHREQGRGDGQYIDEGSRQRHIGIGGPQSGDGAPEPVLVLAMQAAAHAACRRVGKAREDDPARITSRQFVGGDFGLPAEPRIENRAVGLVALKQDAGATVFRKDDGWQKDIAQVVEGAFHHLGHIAGPLQRTHRQCRCQPAVFERQSSQQ